MSYISERTCNLGTENAFVVLGEVNKRLREGQDIISFCIGQPDFDSTEAAKKAMIEAVNLGKSGYTSSQGIPELREAAAAYFTRTRGIEAKPEHVVIAGGGKPFIAMAISSVTDFGKGHEIIYPNPGYPIYEAQARAQGCKLVPINLKEEKGFVFDMEELKKLVNENTRLLILCSPQNPTGGVLSKEELEQIAEIVKPFPKLWVYSDEVYSELCYDKPFVSIASIPGMKDKTIIADCASKTFAVTGWRIGYCYNEILTDSLTKWVTNLESCANQPGQWAIAAALRDSWDEVKERNSIFKKRRDLIVGLLNEIPGFKCQSPGGAFYVWPNVTEACKLVGAVDSEELRTKLLEEAGVAVLADHHFGKTIEGEGQHIRFSYATSSDNIKKGIERIKQFMEEKQK